jgi:hypothetical protein
MVRFRVVILDELDRIQEVIYESKEYKDQWDPEWNNDYYLTLIDFNKKYDLSDWENAPYLETQILEDAINEGIWHFHSSVIEDWFNL